MRLRDIIHVSTTTVLEHDSYDKVLEKFKLSELEFLPVIDTNGVCLGSIYLSKLENASTNHFSIREHTHPILAQELDHIIEAIRTCVRNNVEGLIITDDEGFLMGYVTLKELFHHFSMISGLMEPGSMIIIETQLNNYSLSEISKIIESNGSSVLHQYASTHPDSQVIQVTLIVNTVELGDIISSFERFKYAVIYYSSSTEREDLMKERYDSLMHYLEI